MKHSDALKHFQSAPGELSQRYLTFLNRHPARKVETPAGGWSYHAAGEGEECLLLLAGGARFGDAWFGLITELEHEYRLISPTDPGAQSMEELVAGTVGVLDQEGVSRAHVVGTSFGGLLAQCLTRGHPERVCSMILANTLLPDTIPGWVWSLSLSLARLYPTRLLQAAPKWNMRLLMSDRQTKPFWNAYWRYKEETHLRTMTRAEALSQYRVALDLARNDRFSAEDLQAWNGKVLLIESENDLAFIRRAAPSLRALYPGASVRSFANAGHTPGYSRPRDFARVLRTFLE